MILCTIKRRHYEGERTFSANNSSDLCTSTWDTTLLNPSEGNTVPTSSLLLDPHILVGFDIQRMECAKLNVQVLLSNLSRDFNSCCGCRCGVRCTICSA